MDQKQIAKQVMDLSKAAFDSSFDAMTAMQDQTEKLVSSFLEKHSGFPKKVKKESMSGGRHTKKGEKILNRPQMKILKMLPAASPLQK